MTERTRLRVDWFPMEVCQEKREVVLELICSQFERVTRQQQNSGERRNGTWVKVIVM